MQQSIVTCARCGMLKDISGAACSSCGSLDQSITIDLVGVELHCESGNVGTVTDERTASGAKLRTQTPGGAHSDSSLTRKDVSFNINGSIEIGRKGESRALGTLLQKFQEEGFQVTLKTGQDDRGEDGVLQFKDQCLTLQVVLVPRCPKLWHDAIRDSVTTTVPITTSIEWIYEAIQAKHTKTSTGERAKTILILDVGLTGILSSNEVVSTYLDLHNDPHTEFKFASIWLVGPTSSTTIQLGNGSLGFSSAL